MNIFPFVKFLNESPTSWHAVENAATILISKGFTPIAESDSWSQLKPGGKYFTTRNGSSLVAFVLPTDAIQRTSVLGSHTDSPSLKLKPNPLFLKDNLVMLAVEVYGAPLLTSWFNRDLGIAGRIVVETKNGKVETRLVNVSDMPVTLAQLAIHLDREVNDKGFVVNKQEALNAIVGTAEKLPTLAELLHVDDVILAHDLFLYPLDPARTSGLNDCFISGYRIDNLASAYASIETLGAKSPTKDTLLVAALWDHEEIGSQSHFSAGGPFVKGVLVRLIPDSEEYHRMLARSVCLSIDLAHATHPNANDKHEPRHVIRLGGGVVLKYSSGFRYATDAETAAAVMQVAARKKIPLQQFVTHGNIPAGSTIGPIHAGVTGMRTVDIGIPQLSMHSIRELIAVDDLIYLLRLLDCWASD
jgi:aspartyl aminopeptidase